MTLLNSMITEKLQKFKVRVEVGYFEKVWLGRRPRSFSVSSKSKKKKRECTIAKKLVLPPIYIFAGRRCCSITNKAQELAYQRSSPFWP